MLLFEPMVKVMQISVSLVCIVVLLAICFYIGMTNSSAIQRYRDLHEFRKTEPDDKTSRTTFIQRRISEDTDAVTTEKALTFDANHSSTFNFSIRPTIRKSSAIQRYRNLHEFRKTNLMNDKIPKANNVLKNFNNDDIDAEKTLVPPSVFWNFIRFPSETELSSPTTTKNDYPTDETSTTIPTTTTAISSTTVLPSAIHTRKLSAPILGCSTSCGGCKEITPTSGTITSPNYPEHYYSHSEIGYRYCHYNINAPAGKRIHLVFQELNLAFTDWGDFLEVVDKSPDNYGKILATFYAGDEAVSTMTTGESMLVFFEGNRDGYTKNGKPPAWKASYYFVEN